MTRPAVPRPLRARWVPTPHTCHGCREARPARSWWWHSVATDTLWCGVCAGTREPDTLDRHLPVHPAALDDVASRCGRCRERWPYLCARHARAAAAGGAL